MGTSLSGLTPATTFDGLLKVGDNDPLTATLKPISTGDGTDTMLELSTSALQIGGATGMYWDNTNKRLGIATDAPSVPFEVYGNVRFRNDLNLNGRIYNSASNKVNLNNLVYIQSNVGIGESTPTSRLHVKGSGATSATTSLLVQNGEGSDVLRIYDNRKLRVDGQFELLYGSAFGIAKTTSSLTLSDYTINNRIYTNSNFKSVLYSDSASGGLVGVNNTAPTAQLHIKGSGNDNTTTSLLVQNSVGTNMLLVQDDGVVRVGPNGQSNTLYNGSTKYSIANTTFFGNTNASYFARLEHNVGFQIGNGSSTPTARLQVKGSGATSATTALLVQNSAGTDIFKVKDNEYVEFSSAKWYTYLTSNISFLRRTGAGSMALYIDGSNFLQLSSTGVSIGKYNATAKLNIQGSGATSATTALLVENSAGTDLLKVEDGGKVVAGTGATTNANGTFNVLHKITDSTTRIFTVSRDSVLRGIDINSGGSTKISDSSGDQSFSHNTTAVLEVSSTTQGFLPPRMTTTERDAITTPAAGLMIYNTTTNKAQCYNGTAWQDLF